MAKVKSDSLGALIGQNVVSKADKPKKSSAPVLKLDEELARALDILVEAKQAEKEAKANIKLAEDGLIKFVREKQDADGFAGSYAGSYELQGNQSVKAIFVDKFSVPQEADVIDELKKLLKAKFSEVIEEELSIAIKPEVLKDEEKRNQLAERFGSDFGEYFDVVSSWSVKSGLKEGVYQIAGNEARLAKIREFVKQNKPSFH